MTHEFDGRVKFVSHPSAGKTDVLLEIDPLGRVIGDVEAGLRRWIDDTVGEPTVDVPPGVGDFIFGVPAAEGVLRICADGRVLVRGREVVNDGTIHSRFAAWFGASKVELPTGELARVRLVDPDAADGNFRFTSGRGKGPDREGGDVVLTAGAKRAKVA